MTTQQTVDTARVVPPLREQAATTTRARRKRPRIKIGVELAILLAAITTVVPIAWMLLLAFLPNRAIVDRDWSFPFWLGNFRELFGAGEPFFAQILNSVLITGGTVALCLTIASISGYALSKLNPSKWATVPALVLAAFLPMIPPMTLVPGLYVMMGNLGLLGTIGGLILLNTVFNLPFSVLLLKSFFDQVPTELRESEQMDGASEARTFFAVVLPLVKPGLAAVGIYTAIMAWNEFLFGLTMTSGGRSAPFTVGIASLVQPFAVTWGEMSAAGFIAAVPIVIVAVVANRQIVTGLTVGAVKG